MKLHFKNQQLQEDTYLKFKIVFPSFGMHFKFSSHPQFA